MKKEHANIKFIEKKDESINTNKNSRTSSIDFRSSEDESEGNFNHKKNKNPELKNFEISITTSEKAQNNAKDIQFKKPGVDRNKNAKIINVEKRIYIFIASIDIACVIVDLFCVTMLYFDHFSLVRNKYQFTSNSNRLRFICLGLSLMVILLLIQRMKLILKRDILRNNALYPKSNPSLKDILDKNFIINLIFHIIQPYPNLDFNWRMKILGNDITYSIGMILFVLSIIRFAAFVKIFSFWYIFTSERSRRIYNLLNDNYFLNKINWGFSFRVTNKYYNLMCLIPIFMILIYLYALVFKTFEDFDTDGVYTRFNNISNCIWFILVTMTTIGYGEYTPVTMVGRMIIVTCCIVGVFMISLIFSSFVVLTDLENSEQNAFDQIEYFYMKDRNKDEYQKYLNELIKYKLNKKKKSPGIENLIERFKLDMKRKGIINRKLKKDYSENKVLEDFGIAICKSWERVDEYLINFSKLSPDLLSECEHMKNDGPLLRDQLKSSQKLSFQIFNLAKFNNTCGSLFEIKDLDLINSKSMIQSERLYKALKSFIKVYGSKKVNPALKENGNSDKFDEFFDLENLKNIFNKLPMSPVKHTNTPSDNYFHIKSSIILNNNQTSGNNDNHNTSLTVSKADDLNHINSLDVIDEEISEFDN